MDFTFGTYEKLLQTLIEQGFSFVTFTQYIEDKSYRSPLTAHPPSPVTLPKAFGNPSRIILRHDVEARYGNALRMALIEHKLGIRGSFYFRIFSKPGNEAVIKQIAEMGHEIGYHYDDLTACKGDYDAALRRFEKNLAYLRTFAPVTTITMEGAPLSRYDNRDLWKWDSFSKAASRYLSPQETDQAPNTEHSTPNNKHQTPKPYNLFGILAEPYFDLDFNQMFYLTDTGRRWDGHLYNVRDKATKENPVTNPHFLQLRYHTTYDLIIAINAKANANSQQPTANSFPNQAMLNFHPQRWNDKHMPWLIEMIWQNIKNQGKLVLSCIRK